MRVHILGPFDMVHHEKSVVPNAAKPATLLALLALNPNRVVPRSVLIEELWGASAPASASMTLNTYMYQLRRRVDGRCPHKRVALETVLHTRGNGYLANLDVASLDVHRFVQLCGRGREQLTKGNLQAARDSLSDAHDLVVGDVLEGVICGSQLKAIALRINEFRLDAERLRSEVELQLGGHREMVGQLRGLLTVHPHREDLWTLLMFALYRSDRRIEALETYRELRSRLRDDVGIEPSRTLQRLHQDILADAPELLEDTHYLATALTAGVPRTTVPAGWADIEATDVWGLQRGASRT